MDPSAFLASFYFVCGAIILFLAVTILRHSVRSIVNWSTSLVLFFAGFGPILGAISVFLQQNLREGTYLFKNLVASFDYTWEFFFPSLVLFALVHPRAQRIWPYIKRYAVLLFVPHLFHLILIIFLIDTVEPARVFHPLTNIPVPPGVAATAMENLANGLTIFLDLLFKAHLQLFSLVNISYAAFSLVLLGKSIRLELPPRVRRQMKVVVIGLGLCILTYSFARLIPVFSDWEVEGDMAIGFINASLILGGGSIAFAIVRYQFLDMRLIARKGIFYGAAVLVFASIYLLVVKQVIAFFSRFSGEGIEILETGLIILFIIVLQPVLSRLEDWMENLLSREERTPRVRIRDLSGDLLSMVEVESMTGKIKESLSKVFRAEEVELVFASEVLGNQDEDIYAKRVIEVLGQVGEPMVRLDFMEAMDFLNLRTRVLFRPGRKAIMEAVEALPDIVRRFARFELIVPVMRDGECVAVLLLGPRVQHGGYSAEEQALLSMLASQISASLSRMELLEEVVEKKVLEEELNIARSIQLNLLPSSAPQLEGYDVSALSLSSKQVGGDYYDFISSNSHLAFAVADVSGKGVPASLLMASLQASLRATMDRMDDPVGVVGRLNDVMYENTASDKFATLFYGCLDLRNHEIVYTNAGHFFPVVVRSDAEVEVLDYSGLILGVKPGFKYEKKKLKLKPSDTLVVITDGVIEAENREGELYGEQRLYSLLSSLQGCCADDIKESIVENVNSFAYHRGARDDLTVLVLKRRE